MTASTPSVSRAQALWQAWRWSYLPPLMIYLAAGIQGLTSIVGTFFVKEYLDLSAAFLASLVFWAGIPWALKMPIGHLVDVLWRFKAWLVVIGALLIAASLVIMALLIDQRAFMAAILPVNAWYVLSVLLAPVGYVLQDAVADAMTTEAVPRVDDHGEAIPPDRIHAMHVTMQTLGRVAFVGGTVLVAAVNLWMLADTASLSPALKAQTYRDVYLLALGIPVVSVLGLVLAHRIRAHQRRQLMRQGLSEAMARAHVDPLPVHTPANPWILGASLVFVGLTVSVGLTDWAYSQELIFFTSLGIVGFLMRRLMVQLTPEAQQTLMGTALVIFCYRAVPGPGAGLNWWSIDVLGFDPAFFSVLSLVGACLALASMWVLRPVMARHSVYRLTWWLSVAGTVLALPQLAMSLGFHEWTAAHTGGWVDARFIALVDTAMESPLGQVAMIPLLTWIAHSAPAHLKATYFAVMTSFANLALSAAQLLTRYLNEAMPLAREVKNAAGVVVTPANYSELTPLLLSVMALGLLMPAAAIVVARWLGWRSA